MKKWSRKLYEKFAETNKNSYPSIEHLKALQPESPNNMLREIYFSLKTDEGTKYKPTSLRCIRAGIRRSLLAQPNPYQHDIIEDIQFNSANKMLEDKCKDYVTSPNAKKTQHKPSITDEDLQRIGKWAETATNHPTSLLYL